MKSKLDISTKVVPNEDQIRNNDTQFITHPLFPHPKFSNEECEHIKFEHRTPKTFSDRVLYKMLIATRASFDFVTGYRKPKVEGATHEYDGTRYEMNESKWLTRIIFLELIAGVPGSVALFIRHLHSLRLLRRDKAWIETLLDEAYNERMHLLTFIKLGNPSWFTRSIIYVGQGVFCNLFFLCYLMSPRWCHRFVGYLEEEAVLTYSHLIEELDEPGRLPLFEKTKLPEIAVQYWPELTEQSSFKDLVLRVRADEAKHREVNHTLANLNQSKDRNPFAMKVDGVKIQPENGLGVHKAEGWEREELKL